MISPYEKILSNYLTEARFNLLISRLDLENGHYQSYFSRMKAHVDKYLEDGSIYTNHPYVNAINQTAAGAILDTATIQAEMQTFVLPESTYGVVE
jgi:hypothetical protein